MSIIGGSDGPTSIFIAGRWKSPMNFFRKLRFKIKKKKIYSSWNRPPHTLDEVILYIVQKYNAVELPADNRERQESFHSFKAGLVAKYYPELLEERPVSPASVDFNDREAVEQLLGEQQKWYERVLMIPDERISCDYHYFVIHLKGKGEIRIETDKVHELFSAGYWAEKHKRRYLQRIVKDIYSYYGMSRKDIEDNSERARALVAVLAAD